MSIPVNLHPAVQTHNVEKLIIKQFALVCQLILEALLVVDQSVLSVLNAHTTKHARTKNVSILVLELVVKMPNVESIITVPFVIAWMVILVTLSQDVILNHVRRQHSL